MLLTSRVTCRSKCLPIIIKYKSQINFYSSINRSLSSATFLTDNNNNNDFSRRCSLTLLTNNNLFKRDFSNNNSFGKRDFHLSSKRFEKENHLLLPPLMPFPVITWPKLLLGIKNWFFINFVIRPYMDREFEFNDFLAGARQAICLVSNKLASGEYDDLKGLVTNDALEEIRRNIAKYSVYQRGLLPVSEDEIFFAFPYQVGIIIPDDQPQPQPSSESKQKRYVEITVVMHCYRGNRDNMEMENAFKMSDEAKKKVMVCNYRFFKDFTVGASDPSWIINMCNHFMPYDYVQK